MKCAQVKNKLIFYYYGDLDESQMRQIREHLEQCPTCRREYNKLALALDYANTEAQMSASGDLWNKINQRIAQTSSKKVKILWLRSVETIAVAAAIALAVFIGSLIGRVYIEQSYQVANDHEIYDDYENLIETFSNFNQTAYLVFDDN